MTGQFTCDTPDHVHSGEVQTNLFVVQRGPPMEKYYKGLP